MNGIGKMRQTSMECLWDDDTNQGNPKEKKMQKKHVMQEKRAKKKINLMWMELET